jgi:hypothetical protein
MALSDASRRTAKNDRLGAEKGTVMERISRARSRLDEIARRLRRPEDLKLYGDLWQDRQYAELAQSEPVAGNGRIRSYKPGMAVHHVAFGDGVVQAVQPDGQDKRVTVRFADGIEKTFIASLVSDKLMPRL